MTKTKRRTHDRPLYYHPWFWAVIGVTALVLMLVLTGVLSRPAPGPEVRPTLDTRREDLIVFTRMIDTVGLEPEFYGNTEEFSKIESLINNGSVQTALQRLDRNRRKAPPKNRLSATAFAGLCRSRLREYPLAIREFQDALSLTDSNTVLLAARLCFNIGYLFQRFSEPESAKEYYSRSLRLLGFHGDGTVPSDLSIRFLPGLLNNLGVATEAIGDTATALSLYLRAAAFVDTTSTHRDAQRLRENIARLSQTRRQ